MKRLFFPLLALFLLVACTNRPGDGEIQRQITERLSIEGGGLFTVESFRKTSDSMSDQNVYVAEVEYDLVFRRSLADLALNLGKRDDPVLAGLDLVALGLKYGQFEAGERLRRSEKATFRKTERGWLLQNDR